MKFYLKKNEEEEVKEELYEFIAITEIDQQAPFIKKVEFTENQNSPLRWIAKGDEPPPDSCEYQCFDLKLSNGICPNMLDNDIYNNGMDSQLIYHNNNIPKLPQKANFSKGNANANANANANGDTNYLDKNFKQSGIKLRYAGDNNIIEEEADSLENSKRMQVMRPSLMEISNLKRNSVSDRSDHSIDKIMIEESKAEDPYWPKAFTEVLDKPIQRVNLPDVILPEEALSSFKFSEMSHEEIWNLINNWK